MTIPRPEVLAAHQPAYLPWPGYFARLLDVDRLLVLDHVQFTERGWQNRNYILTARDRQRQRQRLTVPVRRRFGQALTQVVIADDRWRQRHWRSLTQAYAHTPHWPQWQPQLEAIYTRPWRRLVDLNEALTRLLLEGFGLAVHLERSSTLSPAGTRTQMLIDLAGRTNTRVLRVGAGAAAYLDAQLLTAAGLQVEVATYTPPEGVPGVSALDLLLRHGPAACRLLAAGAHTRPLELAAAVGA